MERYVHLSPRLNDHPVRVALCSVGTYPRQALCFGWRQAPVCDHDRRALGPVLAEVLWDRPWLRSYRCRPDPKVQHPRHPRLVHVLVAPIHRWLQHGNSLPPQRRLARELPPLLLPSGVRVEGKDQRADLPPPVPPPALAPKDRHHTGHAGSEQRQRIKGALADPQWTRASLQRGGVKVTLGTREMVMALGLRHLLGSGILVMLTD